MLLIFEIWQALDQRIVLRLKGSLHEKEKKNKKTVKAKSLWKLEDGAWLTAAKVAQCVAQQFTYLAS